MDENSLKQAMGGNANYAALLAPMVNAMRMAEINNPLRAAMWCAQIGHESVGLRYMEEIADGSAYNGRADLGNIHPGDGPRFKGRGPIQLTGRHNYGAFSRWCHSKGWVDSPTYFVDNPAKVGEPHWGFLAAAYYWTVSRPQLNAMADRGDIEGCTRAINGGLNGIADRRDRYARCMRIAERLVPRGDVKVVEKVLDYSRNDIWQDTDWYCGPASVQTVVKAATGNFLLESQLAREMGTHTGGTDHIGLITGALRRHVPAGNYVTVTMPNDPPTSAQRDKLWDDVVGSIDAGFGVVANIVAPPNNYPRPSYKSTQALAYGGGTVYHYVAIMGYAIDSFGVKHVWFADSGFKPYGCWVSFSQFATLVPPKGYSFADVAPPVVTPPEDNTNDGEVKPINNEGKIQSLVNPNKWFTPEHLVAINDRTNWETHKMVSELLRRAGVDPEKFIADAVARDNEN